MMLWPETLDHHRWGLGLDEAREFARRTSALGEVAFFSYYGALAKPIRDGDRVSRLRRAQVSGEFFDVLGVHPVLGRLLRSSDDVIGAAPVRRGSRETAHVNPRVRSRQPSPLMF
jgi:hypothetical protein